MLYDEFTMEELSNQSCSECRKKIYSCLIIQENTGKVKCPNCGEEFAPLHSI